MTLAEIIPNEDYRFSLRFSRDEPAHFFGATAHNAALMDQRCHWLRLNPETYATLLPEGIELLEETSQLARDWNGFTPAFQVELPWEKCLELGGFWEPDFLLLKCQASGGIRLCGGCLCFPSSWRLTEKIGQSIGAIHDAVPGLNESIGAGIHKFLAGLKPGSAFLRENWGVSRSRELNQHPDRNLPRLDANVGLDEVWLRVEHQALVALPRTHGILFGIRIANHSLPEVKKDAVVTKRLIRALQTMPEEMARYKNVISARGRILELLRDDA